MIYNLPNKNNVTNFALKSWNEHFFSPQASKVLTVFSFHKPHDRICGAQSQFWNGYKLL